MWGGAVFSIILYVHPQKCHWAKCEGCVQRQSCLDSWKIWRQQKSLFSAEWHDAGGDVNPDDLDQHGTVWWKTSWWRLNCFYSLTPRPLRTCENLWLCPGGSWTSDCTVIRTLAQRLFFICDSVCASTAERFRSESWLPVSFTDLINLLLTTERLLWNPREKNTLEEPC